MVCVLLESQYVPRQAPRNAAVVMPPFLSPRHTKTAHMQTTHEFCLGLRDQTKTYSLGKRAPCLLVVVQQLGFACAGSLQAVNDFMIEAAADLSEKELAHCHAYFGSRLVWQSKHKVLPRAILPLVCFSPPLRRGSRFYLSVAFLQLPSSSSYTGAGCGVCCARLFAGLAAVDFLKGRAYLISVYLSIYLYLSISLSMCPFAYPSFYLLPWRKFNGRFKLLRRRQEGQAPLRISSFWFGAAARAADRFPGFLATARDTHKADRLQHHVLGRMSSSRRKVRGDILGTGSRQCLLRKAHTLPDNIVAEDTSCSADELLYCQHGVILFGRADREAAYLGWKATPQITVGFSASKSARQTRALGARVNIARR